MPQANPILVEVTRGEVVESVHRGAAAVVDRRGRLVRFWGDVNAPVYPRSAVKPLQAVALITSGAAGAFEVDTRETALACASHGGEPEHTEAVEQWLGRLGLSAASLECGAHPPSDKTTRDALTLNRGTPSPLHNNCSGKHAGFLTICRHLGFPSAGYIRFDHPVQQLVRDTLENLTGWPLADAATGIDGCGIPVFGIPLRHIAAGMMKLASGEALDQESARACEVIRGAMTAHPHLVAGTDRFCTAVMQAVPNVLVKTGAEGVFCAAVPDQGLGIALKIDDGATRAAEVAIGGVLRMVNAIDDSHFTVLRSKLEPDIPNVSGSKTGVIKTSAELVRPAPRHGPAPTEI